VHKFGYASKYNALDLTRTLSANTSTVSGPAEGGGEVRVVCLLLLYLI